jgi:hypothetical protein
MGLCLPLYGAAAVHCIALPLLRFALQRQYRLSESLAKKFARVLVSIFPVRASAAGSSSNDISALAEFAQLGWTLFLVLQVCLRSARAANRQPKLQRDPIETQIWGQDGTRACLFVCLFVCCSRRYWSTLTSTTHTS